MKYLNNMMKAWMLAGFVGGLLCMGCRQEVTTSDNSSTAQGVNTSQADDSVKWSFKGTEFSAVTIQAKKDDFFGKPGVTIIFFDEKIASGARGFRKNRVEVFFPQQGTEYGKPMSASFHEGSEQVQGSRPGGFDGSLTDAGGKLSGKINIKNMGYDGDCSISGSFETTLTGL